MTGRQIIFEDFGSPEDVLNVVTQQLRPLKDDEIRVEMKLTPINPSDLIPVTGAYRHRTKCPGIPGFEGVGTVVDTGSKVTRELLHTRVLPLRGEGTWQSKVTCPAQFAVPVPDEIDDYTAACLYINPVTAFVICEEVLKLEKGDTLVVNACGSFIGRIFSQLSQLLGFTLIAVARYRHHEVLTALGAAYVIDASAEDVPARIHDITGGCMADKAIDCVGGREGTDLAYSLKRGGTFLTLGLLSGEQVDWQNIHQELSINEMLFHLRHWNKDVSASHWQDTFNKIKQYIIDGALTLDYFDTVYDMEDVNAAIHAVKTTGNNGKIFLSY